MVESLMLIALGFMIATFIGILLSQFIWRRAVTVTTRRLQDGPTLPLEDTPSQADSAAARENEAALHAVRQELTQAKEELSTSKATIESLQSAAQGDTADKGSLAQEIEQKNQEIERVTAELAKSDAKVEAAKGALTEAETKILTLSSDAATKAKEVTELNQALSQSKQEAETAQSGRLKAEGILANVSAAATALMASLPTEAEPAQNEEADEPHKAVEAEDDTATEESAESVESVEASAEEASSDTLIMAASEEKTAPQEDISSETSPLAALQEETAPDASSPPSSPPHQRPQHLRQTQALSRTALPLSQPFQPLMNLVQKTHKQKTQKIRGLQMHLRLTAKPTTRLPLPPSPPLMHGSKPSKKV